MAYQKNRNEMDSEEYMRLRRKLDAAHKKDARELLPAWQNAADNSGLPLLVYLNQQTRNWQDGCASFYAYFEICAHPDEFLSSEQLALWKAAERDIYAAWWDLMPIASKISYFRNEYGEIEIKRNRSGWLPDYPIFE